MARGRPSRAKVYARLDGAMTELRERLGGLPSSKESESSGRTSGTWRRITPPRSKATPWHSVRSRRCSRRDVPSAPSH